MKVICLTIEGVLISMFVLLNILQERSEGELLLELLIGLHIGSVHAARPSPAVVLQLDSFLQGHGPIILFDGVLDEREVRDVAGDVHQLFQVLPQELVVVGGIVDDGTILCVLMRGGWALPMHEVLAKLCFHDFRGLPMPVHRIIRAVVCRQLHREALRNRWVVDHGDQALAFHVHVVELGVVTHETRQLLEVGSFQGKWSIWPAPVATEDELHGPLYALLLQDLLVHLTDLDFRSTKLLNRAEEFLAHGVLFEAGIGDLLLGLLMVQQVHWFILAIILA